MKLNIKLKHLFSQYPDVVATVVFVGSSIKKGRRGQKLCTIYFKLNNSNTLKSLDMPYQSSLLFSPGDQFKNGEYIGTCPLDSEPLINISNIHDAHLEKLQKYINKLGLKISGSDDFDENCLRFSWKGATYILPCERIMCTFFTSHPFLQKLMLSGEVADVHTLIQSEKDIFGRTHVIFEPNISCSMTNNLFEPFVLINYIPGMRQGWINAAESIRDTGTVECTLPLVPNLEISCKCIKVDNIFFVSDIIWHGQPELPSREYSYDAPRKDKSVKKKKEKNYNASKSDGKEALTLANPDKSPGIQNRTRRTTRKSKRDFSIRTKIKRISKGTDEVYSTPEIGTNPEQNLVSTKSATKNGTADKLNIDTEKFLDDIPSNETFELFCAAIRETQQHPDIINASVEFQNFPPLTSICKNPDGSPRDYAFADIATVSGNHWLVVETENCAGLFPVSTLIIPLKSNPAEFAAELIHGLACVGNGHWSTMYLEEFNSPFYILKHSDGRSAQRWAHLIISKISYLSL